MRIRPTIIPSLVLVALVWPAAVTAQPGMAPTATRKATTTYALNTHPLFFHGSPVRVRGTIRATDDGRRIRLAYEGRSVLLAGSAVMGEVTSEGIVEVTGTFVDVGRLDPDDPRLTGIDIAALWPESGGPRSWPAQGELHVLVTETVMPAEPFPAPSLRGLALDPYRYEGEVVTVTGRFRGRNLYADQPVAPGRSRYDFVLQSADASIWVVGKRPRGSGFSFNVDTRVDTSQWLEARGTVRLDRGLVMIEAQDLALAKPTEEHTPADAVVRVPTRGPRPEVVFSVPTQGETGASPTGTVRVQFSRDMTAESFAGQVRAAYQRPANADPLAPPPPALKITTRYVAGIRSLEVTFAEPLLPYRTVVVSFGEGITAMDGAPLVPHELRFETGSQ